LVSALVWLVPLLLLEVAAWQTWRMEIDDAGSDVQNVLTVLTEQAEQVFQAQAMALSWIDQHVKGWTWEDIERSTELRDFIRVVDKSSDYIDLVFLADGGGRVRMTEHHFPSERPLNVSVADRDYFIAARDGTSDIYVGILRENHREHGERHHHLPRRRRDIGAQSERSARHPQTGR
jgi:hypothetical protein